MKDIKLEEVSEPLRSFLLDALKSDGFRLQDASGRSQGGFFSYAEATPEEQEQVWKDIAPIQRKASQALREQGLTEDDLINLVLEDD